MDLRATPLVRSLRALLLAAVVVAAGSVAHASAGGRMPDWASLLTLYAVVAAGCAVVLGGEASARRLVVLTVGGQLVVHGVLSGLAGHTAMTAASHGPHGGTTHPGAATGSSLPVPDWLGHGVQDVLHQPLMAVLHVVAATAVGLWLAVGERSLWSLVRLARCTAVDTLTRAVGALRVHPGVLRAVPRAVGVRAAMVDPMPLLPIWSRGVARRGPPSPHVPH